MSTKLKDAGKLIKSKAYILITDKEGTMAGDFRGFSGLMKIHTLKQLHENTDKVLRKLQGKEKPKRSKNVRNTSGRSKGSSGKQA